MEQAGIITDNTAGKRPRTAGRADSGATGSGSNNNIGGGGRQYSNGQASHHYNGGGYNNANNGMHHHHHRNAPRAERWLCPNGCGNVCEQAAVL